MASINPSLIPTVPPGSLFEVLTTDDTLNIRFLVQTDPVFFEAVNRPIADVAVRNLIIAKTLDAISLRLSHQSLFPFLIVAKVDATTEELDLPASWIWDLHASVPKKWEKLRLAKIKRVSGSNDSSGDITGRLRLIFTAVEQGSDVEVSLFQQDYTIDSDLTYQFLRLQVVSSTEESNAVDAGEAETITGFIIFRTLDTTDETIRPFFLGLAPPPVGTDLDGDGDFDDPAVFEIVDTPAGGPLIDEDFTTVIESHGTGRLVASAWNAIPALDSDVNTWLGAFNFPFRLDATRASSSPILVTIPSVMFREFDMCVPCADQPTGGSGPDFSAVWIGKIRRETADKLTFFFTTFPLEGSTSPVDFATLTLERDFVPGQIVSIVSINNLKSQTGANDEPFRQDFGNGHVVLSSIWGGTSPEIGDFFDAFGAVIDDPADVVFSRPATTLGAPGALSRSPETVPTIGQNEALRGSSARFETPRNPSDDNRYVTELDQGLGDEVNFATKTGFTDNPDIEPIANSGSLTHRVVFLIVDANGDSHNYDDDVLPRLICLFGRDPQFGDFWWDGTRLKFFNGNTWVG